METLRIDPNSVELLDNSAWILYELRRYPESIKLYEKLLINIRDDDEDYKQGIWIGIGNNLLQLKNIKTQSCITTRCLQ